MKGVTRRHCSDLICPEVAQVWKRVERRARPWDGGVSDGKKGNSSGGKGKEAGAAEMAGLGGWEFMVKM